MIENGIKHEEFEFNYKYEPVFTTKARYINIFGGRAAGRSHFGTDYFLHLLTSSHYFRGCFLRNVFGDIKTSLFQDMKDRIEKACNRGSFNEKDFVFDETSYGVKYIPTKNEIISKGFKKSSSNRSAKLKSLAGLTHVLLEEADENSEADVNQLDDSIRSNKVEDIQIILLHNAPPKSHWICKRFYNLVTAYDKQGKEIKGYYAVEPKVNEDILVIFTSYLDNLDNLNNKTIRKYQAYADPLSPFYNLDHYYREVLGLISEGAKGRIFPGWMHVPNSFFSTIHYSSYYGLDFGYSNDPVALVEIKSHNNRNFYKEIIYEAGLTNPALVDLMKIKGVPSDARIYADNEPKSIDEIKLLGYWNIMPAIKGPDSINYGIQVLKSMENYGTQESLNLWKENQDYRWQLDQNGDPTDKPIGKGDHITDAIRMGVVTHKKLGFGSVDISEGTRQDISEDYYRELDELDEL